MVMKTYAERREVKQVKNEATREYLNTLEQIALDVQDFKADLIKDTDRLINSVKDEIRKAKEQYRNREKTLKVRVLEGLKEKREGN